MTTPASTPDTRYTRGYEWTCRTCYAHGWSEMGRPAGGYDHTAATGHTTETSTEATTRPAGTRQEETT